MNKYGLINVKIIILIIKSIKKQHFQQIVNSNKQINTITIYNIQQQTILEKLLNNLQMTIDKMLKTNNKNQKEREKQPFNLLRQKKQFLQKKDRLQQSSQQRFVDNDQQENSEQGEFSFNTNFNLYQQDCKAKYKYQFQYQANILKNNGQKSNNNVGSIYNSSKSNDSLRENLSALQKDEIIEILMEQIREKGISEKVKLLTTSNNNKGSNFINNQNQQSTTKAKAFLELNQKYNDLVLYFQQYIQNTNQAQQHFKKIIEDLKGQKQKLNQKTKMLQSMTMTKKKMQKNLNSQKNSKQYNELNEKQLQKNEEKRLIQELQNTIQNFMTINNELTKKLEKVQKENQNLKLQNEQLKKKLLYWSNQNKNNLHQKQKLQQMEKQKQNLSLCTKKSSKNIGQAHNSNNIKLEKSKNVLTEKNVDSNKKICQNFVNEQLQQEQEESKKSNSNVSSIRSNDSVQNCSSLSSQIREMNLENQSETYLNTIRVLQVTNKQIKIINRKLEKIVQKKSQKIRKLLQDLQKTTQEKLQLKQQYMMAVCKLRQFQLLNLNEKNLQKSNTSTTYHQNFLPIQQQKQETKASVYNYKIPQNINIMKSFDSKTKNTRQRQFDNMSLASRSSTQGPISYTYTSQKQLKMDNRKQKINQSFFDQRFVQQNVNSPKNCLDKVNMKRKKEKQNCDFYEITKQNYQLS